MTTPRRRLVRPAPAAPPTDPRQQRRAQQLRADLERERAALARWMARLRRAFRAAEKCQRRITAFEKRLRQLEG
jgi:hypothetical protein